MKNETAYINVYELARRTGLTVGFLRRQARDKRIPHIVEGRSFRFNLDAVLESLKQRELSNCLQGAKS